MLGGHRSVGCKAEQRHRTTEPPEQLGQPLGFYVPVSLLHAFIPVGSRSMHGHWIKWRCQYLTGTKRSVQSSTRSQIPCNSSLI